MKKRGIFFVIFLVAAAFFLTSCSRSDEPDKKSTLQKKQEKVAHDTAHAIQAPLDEANAAAELAKKQANRAEEIPQQ